MTSSLQDSVDDEVEEIIAGEFVEELESMLGFGDHHEDLENTFSPSSVKSRILLYKFHFVFSVSVGPINTVHPLALTVSFPQDPNMEDTRILLPFFLDLQSPWTSNPPRLGAWEPGPPKWFWELGSLGAWEFGSLG